MRGFAMFGLVALLGGTVFCTSAADAANWPRFRGADGTGVAPDKDIPIHWSRQDILWQKSIPGAGHSSPIIWNNRLFLETSSPDGKERLLLCLQAGDGKPVWSQAVPGAQAHTHHKNTLASSTPATDGKQVYAVFWDGSEIFLHAYDFQTGKPRWEQNLGPFKSQHGAGASPIVFEDKVILLNDQDGDSVLMAFDAAKGERAWQAPREGYRACYSTPFILKRNGEPAQLVVSSTAGITGYNPKSGEKIWHWAWSFTGMPLRTVASPIHSNGLVIANAGDGAGDRYAAAVQLGGQGDVTKTHLAWEKRQTFPYVPTMLTWGKHIYFVNDKGMAGCCDAQTGESVWLERLGGSVTASPILIDGKVYALNEDGDAFVFEAVPHFKLLAKNSLGERVMATPAVAANRLFIRGQNHLYCIGKK